MKIKLIAKIKDVIIGYVFDTDVNITIGREIGNTIAPIIDSISRHHAHIFFADGAWKVEDLGSTNGSLINGHRVEGQVALKSGDALRFGLIDMSVTFDQPAVPAPVTAAEPPKAVAPIPSAAPALEPVAPIKPAAPAPAPAPTPKPAPAPALEPIAPLEPIADLEPIAELEPLTPLEPLEPLSPSQSVPGGTVKSPAINTLKTASKLPTPGGMKPGVRLPTRPTLPTGLKLPPKPGIKPGIKLPPRKA